MAIEREPKEFEEKGNTIIYKKTTYSSIPKKIELAFLSRRFSADQIKDLNAKLKDYNLENTQIIIRQDSAFLANATNKTEAANEITSQNNNTIITELNRQINKYSFKTDNIFPEAKSIFPEISTISIAKQEIFNRTDSTQIMPVAFYEASKTLSDIEQTTLRNWLKVKLKVDTLEIYQRK